MLSGTGEMYQRAVDRSMLGVPMADFVQVRYEKDGADSLMEEWGEYAFLSGWLRRLSVPQGTCRLLRIVRDDMEPTLHRGGVALIDPDRQQPNGGIFAIRLDGNLLLRRLAEVDGMISITADNRAYSSGAAKRSDLAIVGQAVWQSSILLGQHR